LLHTGIPENPGQTHFIYPLISLPYPYFLYFLGIRQLRELLRKGGEIEMLDERKNNTTGIANTSGTFWKDIGKSAVSSALAGIMLGLLTKGVTVVFPKLK